MLEACEASIPLNSEVTLSYMWDLTRKTILYLLIFNKRNSNGDFIQKNTVNEPNVLWFSNLL